MLTDYLSYLFPGE